MKNLASINVAILAGGLGTRLYLQLPGQQKVLAKVGEHLFLEHILDQLNEAGFKNVVICTGYLGNQVQEAFRDNYQSLSLSYSKENSPLGTAGAVRLALPLLVSDQILVTNGDSFFDCSLRKFYQFHLEKKGGGTIVLKEVSDTSRFGRVKLDGNDQIVSFEEKKEKGRRGFINGGIYLLTRSLLLEIPEKKFVSFERDIFPAMIGKRFYGFKSKGRFIDIGTPKSYQEAKEFFSKLAI